MTPAQSTEVAPSTIDTGDDSQWTHILDSWGSMDVALCGTPRGDKPAFPYGSRPGKRYCPDCVRIARARGLL